MTSRKNGQFLIVTLPTWRFCRLGKAEPVYQAVWADNLDFDQVLISKCMIQDHMPDNVLDALEKVFFLLLSRY